MIAYLLRRLFYAFLILIGVVSLIFFLFNVLPGDPARMMLGQRSDEESLAAIRKDLGLDKPASVQYFKYLNDLSPLSVHKKDESSFFYLDPELYSPYLELVSAGDYTLVVKAPYLRRSYQSKREVTEIIADTLPNTFILALASIVFATLVGLLLGTLSAVKKDSLLDRSALVFSALGMSLPSFFAAILIGWLFAFVLSDFTGLNLTGNLYEIDDFGEGIHLQLKNLILPALTLGIRPLAVVTQLSRNSLLDVLSEDYIRTAKAKGLRFSRVLLVHAIPNSLNPVITAVSGWFASMMAGVVFVEYIFGWKGLGYVIVNALNTYDLPVVMGCILTISLIFIVVNALVDILYAWLDPKVRVA